MPNDDEARVVETEESVEGRQKGEVEATKLAKK
jgi:hypothetical protein